MRVDSPLRGAQIETVDDLPAGSSAVGRVFLYEGELYILVGGSPRRVLSLDKGGVVLGGKADIDFATVTGSDLFLYNRGGRLAVVDAAGVSSDIVDTMELPFVGGLDNLRLLYRDRFYSVPANFKGGDFSRGVVQFGKGEGEFDMDIYRRRAVQIKINRVLPPETVTSLGGSRANYNVGASAGAGVVGMAASTQLSVSGRKLLVPGVGIESVRFLKTTTSDEGGSFFYVEVGNRQDRGSRTRTLLDTNLWKVGGSVVSSALALVPSGAASTRNYGIEAVNPYGRPGLVLSREFLSGDSTISNGNVTVGYLSLKVREVKTTDVGLATGDEFAADRWVTLLDSDGNYELAGGVVKSLPIVYRKSNNDGTVSLYLSEDQYSAADAVKLASQRHDFTFSSPISDDSGYWEVGDVMNFAGEIVAISGSKISVDLGRSVSLLGTTPGTPKTGQEVSSPRNKYQLSGGDFARVEIGDRLHKGVVRAKDALSNSIYVEVGSATPPDTGPLTFDYTRLELLESTGEVLAGDRLNLANMGASNEAFEGVPVEKVSQDKLTIFINPYNSVGEQVFNIRPAGADYYGGSSCNAVLRKIVTLKGELPDASWDSGRYRAISAEGDDPVDTRTTDTVVFYFRDLPEEGADMLVRLD